MCEIDSLYDSVTFGIVDRVQGQKLENTQITVTFTLELGFILQDHLKGTQQGRHKLFKRSRCHDVRFSNMLGKHGIDVDYEKGELEVVD